ncbi:MULTISPECIES: RNA polymerase sigma factor [Rufibacter]|uniref:RNA polymerase sigma-70 factor (ECF subfamily) n=1 Tax=Rufibacter quisquiliarum TaxID=1549639 RepID=A0A839GYY2_9BACT|nr:MULTISPECIES: RNA polymerase sigma factor [Rufibacter]MBA9078871.1 RNA polymerase sigma-70 factor (ECF subfamily) [Rufibacter quisquiliarum]
MKLFQSQNPTEADLLKEAIAGKREAQRLLYQRYASKMLAVSKRYARTDFEAEDILQDAFMKVFTHLKNFKGECPVEFWIKRIVINTALKHQRSNRHLMVTDQEEEWEEASEQDCFDSQYGYEELLELVRELPPRYQAVFNLYAIEGFSHKEIGEMLEITESTSKSQYSRARASLRQALLRLTRQYHEKVTG